MKAVTAIRRLLVPGWYVSIVCWLRFKAQVSPRAEVEVTEGLRLGRGTVIGSFTKVKATGGVLSTGEGVRIATGCFLDAQSGGLSIGARAMIGPNCVLVTSGYRFEKLAVPLEDQGFTSQGIQIGRNTFVGSNSVVLDGSVLGDDVIVSPGSVVSGRVPSGTVISGNPARAIFKRR